MGWCSSVDCVSFGDETYGDVKTSRENVRGLIVRGRNVGTYLPCTQIHYISFVCGAHVEALTLWSSLIGPSQNPEIPIGRRSC
jgi:hypothetical protein